MPIINNVRNNGKGYVTTGEKKANSYTVSPVNFVATASPGTSLTIKDVANFDFFNVVQTSASTDLVILDSALEVGTEIELYCVSAVKVGSTASSGIGINGGTDAQVVTLAAGSLYTFVKTTATNIVCTAKSAAGAASAPTPA